MHLISLANYAVNDLTRNLTSRMSVHTKKVLSSLSKKNVLPRFVTLKYIIIMMCFLWPIVKSNWYIFSRILGKT